MDFSSRLKQARLSKGFTLQEVANSIGKTDATIQRYESGKIKTVKTDIIEKLAEFLEVSPAYLMGWDGNTTTDKILIKVKDNSNYDTLKEYLKISDIKYLSVVNWIFDERFSESEQEALIKDFCDIQLGYKEIIEKILNTTFQWNNSYSEYLKFNKKIFPEKSIDDIKISYFKENIDNLQSFLDFINTIPIRFITNSKERNIIKEYEFDTIAAHKTNGELSEIKDVEGLKDLIREVMKEEK